MSPGLVGESGQAGQPVVPNVQPLQTPQQLKEVAVQLPQLVVTVQRSTAVPDDSLMSTIPERSLYFGAASIIITFPSISDNTIIIRT
jgi:hypothetical protein